MLTWITVVLILGLGAAAFLAANFREFSPVRCPILLYHRFVLRKSDLEAYPGTETIFTMLEGDFTRQIDHLRKGGYSFIRAMDVYDFLAHEKALPPKPVLITVDDGWTSNLQIMLPILRRNSIPAIFFITTSPSAWIYRKFHGLDAPLTGQQICAIRDMGFEIGSHTVSHPYLIELSDEEIRREFSESKRHLEQITGGPCHFLSIPGNFYDERIKKIAMECGYLAVFTANVGSVHGRTDRWDIPRLIVEGNFSLSEFDRNLRPGAISTRKVIAGIKKLPPRILGATRYMALRERIFNSPLRSLLIMRRLKLIVLILFLITAILIVALTL